MIALFNRDACFFFICALIISSIYWFFSYKTKYFSGLLHPHGEIAYNVYAHNSIKINPCRLEELGRQEGNQETRIDYADIEYKKFDKPTVYRDVLDTIGYGVLLGLIWKITGSLRYRDIEIVQIFIFSLLMFLIYQIALLLFAHRYAAISSCMAMLLFFPLYHQNVQAMRDIWPYYGTVCLLYGVLAYLHEKISRLLLYVLCSFFALCQFIRPPSFAIVLALSLVLLGAIISNTYSRRRIMTILVSLWITNSLFWMPFMIYNKIAYDRYMVGPVGQNLLEGLGEDPRNPWGYKLNDLWFDEYMKEHYGLIGGTAECDEKARELFWKSVKESPLFFLKMVTSRIIHMIFLPLPWIGSLWNVIAVKKTFKDKARSIITSPAALLDFIVHYLYIVCFLVLAYSGICLLLLK